MANSDAALLLRVRLADGKWAYAKPAFSKNGKIKPLAATINGKVEDHPQGIYAHDRKRGY